MARQSRTNDIRWTAVKIFIAPPLVFGIPAVLVLTLVMGLRRATPVILHVVVALLAIALTAYLLAPRVARWCAHAIWPGCAFGVFLCSIGAFAFGVTGAFTFPEKFTLTAYVLRPLFNFCWGFPIAALTGILFAGAAQQLTSTSADDSGVS